MKITIRSKLVLSEQLKAHIYEIHCRVKMKKAINRENLKTDIRAISGITTVTIIPESENITDVYAYQTLKVKFQPYQVSPGDFLRKVAESLRKFSGKGLVSFNFFPGTLERIEI